MYILLWIFKSVNLKNDLEILWSCQGSDCGEMLRPLSWCLPQDRAAPGTEPAASWLPSPTTIVVSIMEENTGVAVTLAFSVFPGHYYFTYFASVIACAWDRISLTSRVRAGNALPRTFVQLVTVCLVWFWHPGEACLLHLGVSCSEQKGSRDWWLYHSLWVTKWEFI